MGLPYFLRSSSSRKNKRPDRASVRCNRLIERLEQRTLLAGDVRFAVIGDFGVNSTQEGDVANRVKSWNPDLVLTVGDNNYQLGEARTIDTNIGKYYHEFIHPYSGAFGAGSPTGANRFFPSLGNHDWMQPNAQPYLDYFTLPGNERYYSFRQGAVEFFAIDADPHEPDLGFVNASTSTANSVQGQWLKNALAASDAPWKVVYMHHPPFSSGINHGPSPWMQWPYEEWGADAVLAGHEHNYERIQAGGIPYLVNGLGGATNVYTNFRNPPLAGSAVRYAGNWGAMLVDADDAAMTFQFITRDGTVIDSYTLAGEGVAPAAPGFVSATPLSPTQVRIDWRDQSNNETSFQLWRSSDSVNFSQIGTVGADVNTFTDSAAAAGTNYYRVVAANASGSGTSEMASSSAPVAAPSNLTATTISTSQIRLNWIDNSNNETRFDILRSIDNLNFVQVGSAGANATTFTDAALAVGTTYSYRVRAANVVQSSPFSNTVSATTSTSTTTSPMAAPSNLTATALSSAQIRLNWQDNSTAENVFEIWRSTNGTNFVWYRQVAANSTTFTDTGAAPNTTYWYRVRGFNSTGASPFSNIASATTPASGTTGAPAAPSNLVAAAVTSTQIRLTWRDNSANETGFEIWRSLDGVNFTMQAQAPMNITSYNDFSVRPGTRYFYRLRAVNTAGPSAFSNTASLTTPGGTVGVPLAPSNLTATVTSSSSIRLNWVDNSNNENAFEVWRSTDGTNFIFLAQTQANFTTHTDSGLTAGTTYYYRVRAFNGSGNSPFSNTASATPGGVTPVVPAVPSNLTAQAISASQIALNWQDNSNNETRFEIFRSTDGVSFVFRAQAGANVTSFTDSGLTSGVTYFYRVRAVNAAGNSPFSNTASARPGGGTIGSPAAPSNLAAAAVSTSQINLSWQDNSANETRFDIFRSTDGVNFTFLAQVGTNVTSYSNTGLAANVTYHYRVRAANTAGVSTFSNTASATTSGSTITVPAAPTGLSARASAPNQITLNWIDNSTNENRFEVFISTNGTTFAFHAQVGPNVTTYISRSRAAGVTYYYRVRAVNLAGNSGWSNIASARATGTIGSASTFSTMSIAASELGDPDLALLTADHEASVR